MEEGYTTCFSGSAIIRSLQVHDRTWRLSHVEALPPPFTPLVSSRTSPQSTEFRGQDRHPTAPIDALKGNPIPEH